MKHLKYFILTGLACIVLGFGYSLLSQKQNFTYVQAGAMTVPATKVMSHTDSIEQFVKWYDDMCNTFCSLTELSDFQIVGPKINRELNERFSGWHIKLTASDKKSIAKSFKGNLKRLTIYSYNVMKGNGTLNQELTSDQLDMIIKLGEAGVDAIMDTTTYLDYYIKWAVDNYNPPIGG